ncbi:LytTR family DNA-binding domain-containing protein [Flavihumibacter rivuli]|uniref:LytR/AlgR family response regulator transcription factor n=1 Tax=Flavihumibacter rivuli TaxID=2838156 RepID=UPI001BDEF676|nr:LytTR family DNA-binding domain-containing protein [Flavihumibacter rivuli]ULQ57097.1 LytTR family DNA-binding domain-containing protein [Flavihumibacter rivuli]
MTTMIKILVIEDEIPARNKLRRFIEALEEPVQIAGEINSVEGAVAFLRATDIDLVISDIELQDGNAFEIYQQVSLKCPIIFTTAYDQFWMDAFESNGIDYLMKPFSQERFQKAWDKFLRLRHSEKDRDDLLGNLSRMIEEKLAEKKYKKRFTIHTHHDVYFLDIENIVFFQANDGVVFAFDQSGKKHILGYSTLKELEAQLDPQEFFRINRSELISKQHIEKIERDTRNTLAVKMKGYQNYYRTSQSNTPALKEWLDA